VDAHLTGPFREQLEDFEQGRFIIDQQDREQGQVTFIISSMSPGRYKYRAFMTANQYLGDKRKTDRYDNRKGKHLQIETRDNCLKISGMKDQLLSIVNKKYEIG
jgi:hypothetical protein